MISSLVQMPILNKVVSLQNVERANHAELLLEADLASEYFQHL